MSKNPKILELMRSRQKRTSQLHRSHWYNNAPIEIKEIGAILPIIYILMISLSTVSMYIYYNIFNINITNYLEISEILIVTFEDVFQFFTIAFLAFLLSHLAKQILQRKPILLKWKIDKILISFIVLILLVLNISTRIWSVYFYSFLFGSVYYSLAGFSFKKLISNLFLILIFLFTYFISISSQNAKKVKGQNQDITLYLEDGRIIKTNDLVKFIGETKNYLFIFNKEIGNTKVISRNQIKEIDFGKKK